MVSLIRTMCQNIQFFFLTASQSVTMINSETTSILALRIEKLTFGESLDRSIERVMGATKKDKISGNFRKKQVKQGM